MALNETLNANFSLIFSKVSSIKLGTKNILIIAATLLIVSINFNAAFAVHVGSDGSTPELPSKDTFPLITTRGHFSNQGQLQNGATSTSYDTRNIPGGCPGEIVIFVHGWDTTYDQMYDSFIPLMVSLLHNDYRFPLAAFDYDSGKPVLEQGWYEGNLIATQNGPKLAQFIIDYKKGCPQDEVRILGHSMGTRVTLSALNTLYSNQEWNDKNFKIGSVHLMGAAVDDEIVSMNLDDCDGRDLPPFPIPPDPILVERYRILVAVQMLLPCQGNSIQSEVTSFYNLYNPKDFVLLVYSVSVGDRALGQNGYQNGIPLPLNYEQYIITDELPKPDEHVKLMGEIKDGNLVSDGAIDLVVADFKKDKTPPTITLPPSPLIVEAESASGAIVQYTATAVDDVDLGPVAVVCDHLPGSPFPLGNTAVACTAIDQSGNTANAEFVVTVQDTTPPAISIVSAVDGYNIPLANQMGTTVSNSITLQLSVTDKVGVGSVLCYLDLDGNPVSCTSNPVTYTVQSKGQHTVRIVAIDTSNNQATTQFVWTVLTAAQAIEQLAPTIDSMGLLPGVADSLKGPVHQASILLKDNNPNNDRAACNQLDQFINQANGMVRNGQLLPEPANLLTQLAQGIKTSAGCI
jgi:pimeloyl-ACP methyl ester carboxylesterase